MSDVSTPTALTEADMEPVRNFLNSALQGKQNGQPAPYHIIVQQFRVRDDPETLWKVVIALNSFASLLTSRAEMYKELLSAIFTYDWRGELRLTKAILDLTVNLVSTNAIYVTSALELVVQYFVPTFNSLSKDIANDSNRNETLQYIHQIIQKIILQTPTGQNLLFKILKSSFPHKRFSRIEHTEYVNQLLLICEYLPSLEYRILHLIITKCLEMDVEIIIEDTGDVRIQREYEHEYYEEEIFQLDEGFSGENNNNGGLNTSTVVGGGAAGTNRIPVEVADLADKLDCMLYLLVNYIDKQMQKFHELATSADPSTNPTTTTTIPATPATKTSLVPPSADPPSSSGSHSSSSLHPLEHKFYQHMLQIFEHNLLSAFKSKFTQFLIFYLAGKSTTFTELFIQQLVRIGLYSPMASSIKRQSAMMYLASFLSRATFVPLPCINDTLSEMLIWSTYYVHQYHAETIVDLPTPLLTHLTEQLLAKTTTIASVTSSALSDATAAASSAGKKINTPEELHAQMTTYLGYFQPHVLQQQQHSHHHAASSSSLSVASSLTGWTSTTGSTTTGGTSNGGVGMDLFIDHIDYDDYGRMYIKEHTVGQHELFYAVIQSVCYTLCFYGLPLTTLQQQSSYLVYYWNYVFVSRFDPLRYCLKSVKNEFLQLAKIIGLFDEKVWECFAPELLFVNDNDSTHTAVPIWQPVPSSSGNGNSGGEEGGLLDQLLHSLLSSEDATTHHTTTTATANHTNPNQNNYFRKSLGPNTLESFFPFDPCYLVKMHSCVEHFYRSWQGVPGVDDDLLYPHNVSIYGRTYEHLPGHMISDSEVTSTTSTNVNSVASSLVMPASYLSGTYVEDSFLSHPEDSDAAGPTGATTTILSSSLRIAETEVDNYDVMLQEETWRLRQSTTAAAGSGGGGAGNGKLNTSATNTFLSHHAAKSILTASNTSTTQTTTSLTMTNLQEWNNTQYSSTTEQFLHHKSPIALHMAMSPATNELDDVPMRRRPRLYSIGSTGSW